MINDARENVSLTMFKWNLLNLYIYRSYSEQSSEQKIATDNKLFFCVQFFLIYWRAYWI